MIHSATQETPDYQYYGIGRSIYDFRVWGCHIKAVHGTNLTNLADRTETGYILGTAATRSVIRYWHPSKPKTIGFCTTAKFNEYETLDPNGELSPGSKIAQGFPQDQDMEITKDRDKTNPLMKNPIKIMKIKLPPKGKLIGLTISRCDYNNLPYISKSSPSSNYYKSIPTNMRHNVWILTIRNNDSISSEQALEDMKNEQVLNKSIEITMPLSKGDSQVYKRTNIGERWASFDQIRMIKMKIIDSDANNKSISNQTETSNKNEKNKHDNSGYKTIKCNEIRVRW